MPLPKFSNPHLLKQATQTVSRADIYAEHDVSGALDIAGNAQDDVLALEGLLKRSLGDFLFDTSVPQESPTKTDERKHKRRKYNKAEDIQAADEDEIVSFRLFSNAPPKTVSLKPKPSPEFKSVERSYEDDDAEAARRAERAKAVAVDFDWILEQSRQPVYRGHLRKDKVIHATLDAQTGPFPALMVAELPKPPLGTPSLPLASLKLPERERPSPHDFPADKICCPVIFVSEQNNPDTQGKRRRRRRKTGDVVARQPPSFFRPLREWGGKSAGYAMGYEGSRSVAVGSARQWRYRRDSMRSGVMSKW
ncbi:hypothetical protein BC629DRAFT_875835 [Irpex lacteus]|nr:hypothetical protein BC629DRAFT_875835 [Irpex lacteus]